ncbi:MULTISPECIES: S10 family serine carboxypeptidase-like protein [Paraburkholderia]|uniref:Carboxypeptidase C (Cathepsin A) n=1 Tax=Paraburkholderia tropica TaxID=92647 RepID=A0A1A5XEX7_9BURK|nr:carboxypeptidase C (cathepsin A) [Paraburkholderia tropica]OBR52036.1 peptidase S10 [Paraburkholderia tropica]PXX15769.1 carboxypeptidase C (cathepsin A) [Paraburkholderia tropica]PZW82028.1 carboxypeptidase C (cathepsin A) [Paraburkholderia tropica]RQN37439.1 peptidase S10 [Paraburkholderia tropica]
MKSDGSSGLLHSRIFAMRSASALCIAALMLAGCGGDSGSGASATAFKQVSANAQDASQSSAANRPYSDPVAYSLNAGDGLAPTQVAERSAVMHYQWTSGSTTINYTTTTGHLTARDTKGNAEASMSYVAYTAPSTNGSPRPVTFVYNGGPGSSSIWLRLGSFAPTRVATPDPLMTNWPNYPLVDNTESLIDTTDMVFIDPPGTGLSEAILPNTNQKFWGCDPDVNVMRDFIQRYLAVNNRSASPIYLYGESYGTPRTDMLALALEASGVKLTGIVLQSAILNYYADAIEATAIENSTAGLALDTDTLAGYYPGYAEVAAYFNLASPRLIDQGLFAQQSEIFATGQYNHFKKYAQTWVLSQLGIPDALGTPVLPPTRTLESWQWPSSLTMQGLQGYFNTNPFNNAMIPGTTIGRYDGRVSLPNSDPRLQADSDPSDILISQPFTTALATQMPDYLGYTAPNATYMPLNDAIIQVWDFSHDGETLPDTLPDLVGAIKLNPNLKVLSENGYHDLATPFFNTEKQLARLQTVAGLSPNLQVNFFPGGHMIYLDDVARPKMKADLVNYYAGQPIPLALSLWTLPAPWSDESSGSTPTTTATTTATETAQTATLQ